MPQLDVLLMIVILMALEVSIIIVIFLILQDNDNFTKMVFFNSEKRTLLLDPIFPYKKDHSEPKVVLTTYVVQPLVI
jgi:hypothetical protein